MSPDTIPINWFDLALVVVLLLGSWRGRQHGMSEETLPLVKWIIILFGAALTYERVGDFVLRNTPFGRLLSYISGYLIVVLAVFALFSLFKRALGGKLIGSDFFGPTEYYLGIGAGMVRFTCILLVGLALLNARLYSTSEVRAMRKYQDDVYGSNFFPSLQTVQESVFTESLTGPQIQKYCGHLLIRPTPPGGGKLQRTRREAPVF